jgi:hypothetical protein
VSLRRIPILAASAVLALGMTACHKEAHPHTADNEGFYVDAGPITYQVQLSRELSPYDIEDKEYLNGIPAGTPAPKPDEEWFGIFPWAKNQSGSTQTTPDSSSFDIVDTQGRHYQPVPIDPTVNPYAWTSETLKPGATEPLRSSLASTGPTQGQEVLFKINVSAYANRPLILEIRGPAQQVLATVSLDL